MKREIFSEDTLKLIVVNIVLSGLIIALGITGIIISVRYADNSVETGDCVTETAKAQGYAGTPYEKWQLFAEFCNK